MNSQVQTSESLGYYPSEYITERSRSTSKVASGLCLKESVIAEFWREAVKAIGNMSDADNDGVIYTSDRIGVFLGPWDIDIRHNYKWTDIPGGDTYMGFAEPHGELAESFEVVGAHDYDNGVELHGVIRVLNEHYKRHENEILNYR